ncbi:alpha-galactosidase [Candidatus Poribacteria bacterium]|nr:alpha-galactosidase [Candidatus Poribacteria bacterium]
MLQGAGDLTFAREGRRVIAKNNLFQVNFNLSKGTWSYIDQTGHSVIKNAYTKIVLQNGTVLTTLDAGLCEFITHPITQDEFGLYQPITFSHQAEGRGLCIRLYLNCYSKKPYIVFSVGLENLNEKPIALAQMSVIDVSPLNGPSPPAPLEAGRPLGTAGERGEGRGGGVYLGGDPSGYHTFLNMNTPITHGTRNVYDGFRVNKETSAQVCYDGVLYDTDSKRSLVFGFLSAQKWWSTIQVGYDARRQPNKEETHGIDQWSLYHKCGNHLCLPGEEVGSEPVYLNFAGKATESYQLYTEMVAKRMNAKTLDHVFSGWCTCPFVTLRASSASNQEAIDTKQIAQQVDLLAKNRLFYPSIPGGIEYIQIESIGHRSWEGEAPAEANPPNASNDMKWVADQIHAKGLKAGLRFAPFSVDRDSNLLKTHPEYFLQDSEKHPATIVLPDGTPVALLDVSRPGAQGYIRERMQQIIGEWGYDLVKADLLGYTMGPMFDFDNFVWHDKSLTAVELYRKGIALLNQMIQESPKNVLLAACNTCNGPSIGGFLLNEVLPNYGGQIGEELWQDKTGVKQFVSAYAAYLLLHNISWTNAFGALRIGEPISLNEAIVTLTAAALSGGVVMCGDDLTTLKPARAELLAKLFPLGQQAATAVDLYENKFPQIWNLRVQAPYESWQVVGAFNWGDGVDDIYFTLDSLGLDRSKYYLVHDFWNREYLGTFRGSVTLLDVPPRSAKLLCIRAEQDVPQLLATDIHFTQGGVEVLSAGWERRSQSLLAVCKNPKFSKGTFFIYVPEDYVPVATACYGCQYHFRWRKPIYEIEFSPTTDLVHFSIQFGKTSG